MEESFQHLKPIYPFIARQVKDDYNITQGICLDIGTGPGHMGIALAKMTDFEMYFVDISSEAIEKAKNNVLKAKLKNKLNFIEADVCNLPFEDEFADFIISRGSIWFWHDQIRGLQEIHRVLKKGGIAFAGGGLGRNIPLYLYGLQGKGRKRLTEKGEKGFLSGDKLQELINKTGIANCKLISDAQNSPGTWIEIRK